MCETKHQVLKLHWEQEGTSPNVCWCYPHRERGRGQIPTSAEVPPPPALTCMAPRFSISCSGLEDPRRTELTPSFLRHHAGNKVTRWSGTWASQHSVTPDPNVCQSFYLCLKNLNNIVCHSLYWAPPAWPGRWCTDQLNYLADLPASHLPLVQQWASLQGLIFPCHESHGFTSWLCESGIIFPTGVRGIVSLGSQQCKEKMII